MKVLIGCEESQTVCAAFRNKGIEAYSCDILPCSGGHPEWHLQMDIFEAIKLKRWDLMIAHPECTYAAVSGSQWLSHPEDRDLPYNQRRPNPKYPDRRQNLAKSLVFVKALHYCQIPKVAIENPIGMFSTLWRKPDQIIHPWQFGDEAEKPTCLWLKNLPLVKPTNIVGKGERIYFKSGKSLPKWYDNARNTARTDEERRRIRSTTFPGIAQGFTQWIQK